MGGFASALGTQSDRQRGSAAASQASNCDVSTVVTQPRSGYAHASAPGTIASYPHPCTLWQWGQHMRGPSPCSPYHLASYKLGICKLGKLAYASFQTTVHHPHQVQRLLLIVCSVHGQVAEVGALLLILHHKHLILHWKKTKLVVRVMVGNKLTDAGCVMLACPICCNASAPFCPALMAYRLPHQRQ